MSETNMGYEAGESTAEKLARQRDYDFERLKLASTAHFVAADKFRERTVTLASVVFGLSLLALQLDDPVNKELAISAWFMLGGSIVASLLGGFFELAEAYYVRHKVRRFWLAGEAIPDQLSINLTSYVNSLLLVIPMFLLAGGVFQLIRFAVENFR
ncbi:MAG: hypothetical protein HQ477_02090 [Chloroflexi bacterium]|nr:hypothetical protein [Chloroflexota bacterium]